MRYRYPPPRIDLALIKDKIFIEPVSDKPPVERIDVIGQNGNDGLHYGDLNFSPPETSLTPNEYQRKIRQFSVYPDAGSTSIRELMYLALGLNGEAGEVAEIAKKRYRDMTPVDVGAMKKELGDVLWYLTRLADIYGIHLQDVLDSNYRKLLDRLTRGVIKGNGNDR